MAAASQGGFRPGEDVAPPAPSSSPNISFTQAADAGGTDADVLMGYQLILGRDPESSFVIADAKNSPVGAFIRALMGSGEFQSAVLDKLAANRALPHENASAAPRPDQLDWLFRHMRVPPRAEQMLRTAPNWAEWLRMLVAVPGFPAAPARGAAPVPDGVSPQQAADGFVLIHIESPKPGERLSPGGLIQGNGWAIAPADVAEVAIELDGRLLTHARYGLPRPDVARSFPHYRHVDHCGFSFSVEVPADTQPEGAAQLTVRVRSVRGDTGQKGVRLLLRTPAAQAEPGADAAQAAWPIRLAVEEAVADAARMLRVRGWAVSAAKMQPIAIVLGNLQLGEAPTNLARPDIGAAHPNYANAGHSGFAFAAPIPADVPHGPNFVRVQARDEAGHVRQTIMPVQVPPHAGSALEPAAASSVQDNAETGGEEAISASCDMASLSTEGALTLGGWAVAAGGVPTLRVDLDGITLGEVKPARPRPDVAARFASNQHATHAGFTFFHQLPRRPKKGVHTLSLLISGPSGGKRVLELPVVPDPNAASAPAKRTAASTSAAPQPKSDLPPATVPGMRLEIDRPAIKEGAAHEPVRGALTVAGWAAARHGVSGVSVFCDELMLGHAHLGMRREDIGAAFPEYQGSLLAGYALVLPPGTLPEGKHTIRVLSTGSAEEGADSALDLPVLERRFTLKVERYDALPPEGSVRFGVPPAETALGIGLLERAGWRPEFRIVISAPPASPFDAGALEATLASLSGQVWRHWSATVHMPDAESARLAALNQHIADPSGRVELAPVPGTRRTTKAAPAAKPKTTKSSTAKPGPDSPVFLVKLRPGDRLGADALLELALESAAHRGARFIYADELRHDPAQARRQPFFKPDFSPDLLLGMNYIGRPWAAAASLATEAGLTAASLAQSADYDAVLRLTETARAGSPDAITHIPRVLADRGPSSDSPEAELAALQAAMARRELPSHIEPGRVPGTWRVRRQPGKRAQTGTRRPRGTIAGRISIVIPTCAAGDLIRTAIKTIRANSAPTLKDGHDVEIVVLDNTSVRETRTRAWLRRSADVVVDMPGAFNWSRFNNVGAHAATGEYLLFLNDDIEIRQPDWLDAMLDYARRPDVGVVGVRLLYPDGKVQHGGQYLADNHARHAFRFAENTSPGPFGLATVAREVISVTGACQMIRARTFRELGGFEEAHSVVNNDLDFCLRSWQAGLSVIYTPYVTLTHHELASRAALEDSYDEARFLGAWRSRFLRGDPYRSPRLALEADHFGADPEPAVLLHAGRRGPPADAVRRILAVKLDHIGDFLTALPALRSLKRRFPAARIDLLAPAATAELARHEPTIAETIVFDFFHARSGEGQKGVGETEFRALAERLAPAHYDIAIDLRMQPETRDVLRHTGAAFLAGYDFDNRFPFLDVALTWEGDSRLVLKRAHVSERLIQLVSATEDACRAEATPPDAAPLKPADVPALAALPAAFLARPLVCIHPGVGNPVRQWPAANYAALIGLLAEDGLHVVLVGGPDEAAIAEDVLRRVPVPGTAESLVGRVRLGDLADVMRGCTLFVGNNSGPKHLAASLGLPTIGIHSGVVDATEWAPLGRQAVAIRRQMICGPCYLEFASDCPRDLACLTGLRPRDVLTACRRLLAAT